MSLKVSGDSSPRVSLVPAMSNLMSALGQSDISLKEEISKTSQSVAVFIEQQGQQQEMLMGRNAALEGRIIELESEREEREKMYAALLQGMRELTETVNRVAEQLGQRMDAMEDKMRDLDKRCTVLQANFVRHRHNLGFTQGGLTGHITHGPIY